MDLLDYLRLIRRRWRLLFACALVAGVAAWVVTPAEPADDNVTYRATHQLLRDSSAFAQSSLAQVALFVKTGEVPIRVAERVGFEGEPAVLASRVTLETDEQVGTLEISATGNSPTEAAERANAFAEETLALLGEQASESQQERLSRVNEQLTTLQADIDALNDAIAEEALAGEEPGTLSAERDSKLRLYGAALDQQQQVLNEPPPSAGYVTLQEALPELAAVESGGFAAPSSRPARTAIAVGIGLFLGLGVILLVERLDTRLHDSDDIAGALGFPVIAEVPRDSRSKNGRILVADQPMSSTAEAYRTFRAALLLAPVVSGRTQGETIDGGPRSILVTSGAPGDGKTTTVVNLAASMAETGRTVLVLGCDFRRPEVHDYFFCPVAPGIADVLTDDSNVGVVDIVRSTQIAGVYCAPSGNQLRSFGDVAAAGRNLIAQARKLADVVIIDTPPLLATNDASELIPAVDAVVLVTRVDKTTKDAAKRVRTLLARLDAPVSGAVAIGVADTADRYSSYYTTDSGDSAPVTPGPAAPVLAPRSEPRPVPEPAPAPQPAPSEASAVESDAAADDTRAARGPQADDVVSPVSEPSSVPTSGEVEVSTPESRANPTRREARAARSGDQIHADRSVSNGDHAVHPGRKVTTRSNQSVDESGVEGSGS